MLRAVSLMIHNAVREVGDVNDFIGHHSSIKFVVVTIPTKVMILNERIITRLEQSLDYFYPIQDREQGDIQENRLQVLTSYLIASSDHFEDLEDLKTAILHQSA